MCVDTLSLSRSEAVMAVFWLYVVRGILVCRRNGHGERREGMMERGGELPSLIHTRAPNPKDTSHESLQPSDFGPRPLSPHAIVHGKTKLN